MSLNYINNFKETINHSTGISSALLSKLSNCSTSTLLGGVRNILVQLRESNHFSDALASFWEFMQSYFNPSDVAQISTKLLADDYDLGGIFSTTSMSNASVKKFISDLFNSDINHTGYVDLSDAAGRVYTLISRSQIDFSEWTSSVDASRVLLATTKKPKDLDDVFMLTASNDRTIVNLVMRSVNYADEVVDGTKTVVSGYISDVYSIFKSKMESTAINDVLTEACNFVIRGGGSISDMISTIDAQYTEMCSAGKRTLNKCVQAYNEYGFKGLCVLICKLYGVQGTFDESDGVMVFTDNASLAPKEYIAGHILSVISTVAAAAATIAMAASRVLGAVIGAISLITGLIAKCVSIDWSETRCGLNFEESVLPVVPYGICQSTIPLSEFTSDQVEVIHNLLSVFGTGQCPTVGGWWLFGYGDAERTSINIEFHPSCLPINPTDSDSYMSWVNKITGGGQFGYVKTSSNGYYLTGGTVNLATKYNLVQMYAEMVNVIPASYYDHVDSVGRADATLDAWLRTNITRNLMLFLIYCLACDSTNSAATTVTINYTNQYFLCSAASSAASAPVTLPDSYNGGFESVLLPILFFNMADNLFSRLQGFSWSKLTEIVLKYQVRSYSSGSGKWAKYLFYQDTTDGVLVATLNGGLRAGTFGCITATKDLRSPEIGDAEPINQFKNYILALPAYNPTTFWLNLVVTGIIAIAVTVATVVTVINVRKAVQLKRAQNQAAVESSWNSYVANPTSENLTLYRNAVKKNNLQAMVIGGTKYSKVNYWDTSNDSVASKGAVSLLSLTGDEDTVAAKSLKQLIGIPDVQDDIHTVLVKITG